MKKVLVFGFELYIFLINMPVMIGVAELFILFANMRTGVISYNISYCMIILILATIIVVMAFVGKYGKTGILKRIRLSVFVLCEGILGIMLITFGAREAKVFKGALLLVSLLLTFSIIFTVHKSEIFSGNKCCVIKVVRMIRYSILIVHTIIYFMNLHFLDNDILWVVWSLPCYFEYIWMLTHDDIGRVSVILHTKLGEKITRNRIIQYEADKIGYTLLDGKVEIIDNDEVEAITYQITHLLFKGNMGKKRVTCKLRSGKLIEFQNYRLVNDTWVKFIKDKNRIRDVLLVKIKDTESIVEEK